MNTATTAAPKLPPGTVIDGTYTTGAVVRSRLGAVTYAATDLSRNRVDVTVYAPECFVSPVALERSLRELRQLEKVHAPQVLRIFDAGKLPQGGIYEVHEHVEGQSLAELGAIPPAEVAPLIHEIVTALQAAQKVGVLHRNLGAQAVLRGERGIKLTGFAVGDPQGGVSFGALDCIAPEQVEGKNIDERTLVYNLAALTYRFLRGASLFTGGDSGTQLLQAAASLPPPESMPAPLFAALAKDPKSRPNLLQKFLGELDAIVREFPHSSQPPAAAPDRAGSAADPTPDSPADAPEPMTDLRTERAPEPEARREPTVDRRAERAPANMSEGSEEREVNDTLDSLMTDPDAPKLPSPEAKSPEAKPNPTRPAIVTGPGTISPPPSSSKPPVPSLGAPPPSLGKPAAPALGLPSPGKPPLPSIGGPPNLPSLGGGPIAPPSLGPLAPPSIGPPGAPSIGPPSAAAAPAAAGAAKPRTRGWTMFMEVTEDEAANPATPGVPLPGAPGAPAAPVPVAGAPVAGAPIAGAPVAGAPLAPMPAAPAPAPPAPATPTGEVKPSTRGWTMIMDEPSDADPAALGLSTPAAAASPPPPSPTTRGWTMLEELNDSLPASATPATPATPAAPASEVSGVSSAPSSRGWTMFMEAELQGGAKPEEPATPDAEPEFFDGQVQTDSGTVIAFAPTAAEPTASFTRSRAEEDDVAAQEPMTSFGARLRGEPEEAAPLAPSLTPESAPSHSAEIPSFAGNNLGFSVVADTKPAPPTTRPEPQPDALDSDLEAAPGGNSKLIVIGVVVVVALVVAIILATR